MKVAIKTLGCKVNQVESDILTTTFSQEGIEVVNFGEKADLYIVNSCAVTREAEPVYSEQLCSDQRSRKQNSTTGKQSLAK